MAQRGVIRFPGVVNGGKRICITPRGLDYLNERGVLGYYRD
jgi:hypothetical protein